MGMNASGRFMRNGEFPHGFEYLLWLRIVFIVFRKYCVNSVPYLWLSFTSATSTAMYHTMIYYVYLYDELFGRLAVPLKCNNNQ